MKSWFVFLSVLILSACNAMPVTYVGASGKFGSGQINGGPVNMSDGAFSISDKGVTCSGKFPSWTNLTIVFPVTCTDGATGSVNMTRPFNGPIAGEGSLSLSTGENRRFVYGRY